MALTPEIFDERVPDEAYKTPTPETDDSELLTIAKAWEKESSAYHQELERIWKQNEDYYFGRQTEIDRIPADMSNAVQNHIFMGVETIVPIMTANPPQFVVEPPEESDTAVDYAATVQQALGAVYETKDIRTKGEMLMRHMVVYRFGAWKVFWDYDERDMNVKYVRPKRLYFPKVATKLPYVMEQVDITADEFKDVFSEEKFKEFLKQKQEKVSEETLRKVSGMYTIWEIWTPRMVFWKGGNMIIEKRKNPNYDFENRGKNHFEEPRIPYIIASAFRLGNEAVGETDLIQQTIPIQDIINVSSRLIINNATKTGNAQWFIDAQVMSEEEAHTKITNAPGLVIHGSGVANQSLMRRDAPLPLPAYIENVKIFAERAFDNIFGTHGTTRGERGEQETLGGRMLLKQADIGRIDLLVREYERCVAELGNWFVQLMRLNYGSKRTFRFYGDTGLKFINLMPEMVQKGIKVIVKSGTTLPTDEISKRREALELWSLGALDPVTLFERLKFPNPEETAQKLQAWRTGQLALEAQMKQGADMGRGTQPLPSPQEEIGRLGGRISQGEFTGGV